MENAASILILISGFAHAVVNAILKAGNDKFSALAIAIVQSDSFQKRRGGSRD